MIRIVCLSPNINDATAFWRTVSPLSELSKMKTKNGDDISVQFVRQNFDVSYIMEADIVLLQRPFHPDHLQIAEAVKLLNKKLWIDHDDHLLGVTRSNPAFDTYKQQAIRETILKIIHISDVTTVTTDHLALEYAKFFEKSPKNFIVVPNAWNERTHPFASIDVPKAPWKRILWRGSKHHDEDVDDAIPDLQRINKDFPGWTFVFVGNPPYRVADALPKDATKFADPLPIQKYFSFLRSLQTDVCLVPLRDHGFNRAKSNIAALEVNSGNTHVIAPDFDAWQDLGLSLYTRQKGIYETFCEFAADVSYDTRRARIEKTRQLIKEKYVLSVVNQKRMQIVEELMNV